MQEGRSRPVLFLGLSLSPGVRASLAALTAGFGRALAARWVPPANYHLTLRHFGPVSPRRQRTIARRAGELAAGCRPAGLTIARLGLFGTPWRPKVLWAGAGKVSARLAALADAVAAAFPHKGSPPWVPHVTLARFPRSVERRAREEWRQALSPMREGGVGIKPVACRFREVVLCESVRGKGTVRYEVRARLPMRVGRPP